MTAMLGSAEYCHTEQMFASKIWKKGQQLTSKWYGKSQSSSQFSAPVEFANPDSSWDQEEAHALKPIIFLGMWFFINKNVFL